VGKGGGEVRAGGGAADNEAKVWVCVMQRRGRRLGFTLRDDPLQRVPCVVDAGWKGIFGSEAVARSDADHVVAGDEEAKEWDLPLGVTDTMAAAVEHQEYREAAAWLSSQIRSGWFEDNDTRHVAIAHWDVVDFFCDIFGAV
jgi:hypothetical protein